jgi:hypothetical protein
MEHIEPDLWLSASMVWLYSTGLADRASTRRSCRPGERQYIYVGLSPLISLMTARAGQVLVQPRTSARLPVPCRSTPAVQSVD